MIKFFALTLLLATQSVQGNKDYYGLDPDMVERELVVALETAAMMGNETDGMNVTDTNATVVEEAVEEVIVCSTEVYFKNNGGRCLPCRPNCNPAQCDPESDMYMVYPTADCVDDVDEPAVVEPAAEEPAAEEPAAEEPAAEEPAAEEEEDVAEEAPACSDVFFLTGGGRCRQCNANCRPAQCNPSSDVYMVYTTNACDEPASRSGSDLNEKEGVADVVSAGSYAGTVASILSLPVIALMV